MSSDIDVIFKECIDVGNAMSRMSIKRGRILVSVVYSTWWSTFLLLPFGAGLILGVYVTVRVTTSLT